MLEAVQQTNINKNTLLLTVFAQHKSLVAHVIADALWIDYRSS
jgi:hypothetical protein